MQDLPALRMLLDARAEIADGGHDGLTLLEAAAPADAKFRQPVPIQIGTLVLTWPNRALPQKQCGRHGR
jgi:hypothetical protein